MKLEGTTRRIMELLRECNTVKEISSRLNIHPKNVDRYIKVLRDLGLVTTKKGKKGGVYLTEEGKYLLERGHVSLLTRKIRIVAEDRIGLLADISSKISEIGGNILSTTLEREDNQVVIWLEIENVDVEKLRKVLEPYVKSLVVV